MLLIGHLSVAAFGNRTSQLLRQMTHICISGGRNRPRTFTPPIMVVDNRAGRVNPRDPKLDVLRRLH